jgi:hypothetical protein
MRWSPDGLSESQSALDWSVAGLPADFDSSGFLSVMNTAAESVAAAMREMTAAFETLTPAVTDVTAKLQILPPPLLTGYRRGDQWADRNGVKWRVGGRRELRWVRCGRAVERWWP